MNQSSLVLVFGATGASGFHVARVLLDHGYPVRIVVRSKAKALNMFKGKQSAFQRIIEGNLNDNKVLEEAFKPSQKYGKIKYVISTLGAKIGSKDGIEQIEYTYQKNLIDRSKQAGIEKYIFQTAFLMTRPEHHYHKQINQILPTCYYWKARAENYLRKSGLNYIIVRPPNLTGYENDHTVTGFDLIQGDNHTGGKTITRSTVAQIIRKLIEIKDIPTKVTFVCVGNQKPKIEHSISHLKPDNEDSIVKLPENPC